MPAHIYNFDPATDGWKAVPSEKADKTYTIDAGKRGKITRTSPVLHYFLAGKSMCDKFPTEPADAVFQNNTHAYCDACLPGCRKFAIDSKALETAGDESKNVIDYKAAEKKDKPETAKVTH